MDLRTLTKLLLKLVGLYWLTASLVGLISYGAFTLSGSGHDTTPYLMFNLAGYFVVGAAFLWFPGTIVNNVLRIRGVEFEGGVTADLLLGVGIALLGVYFTVVSISALIFTVGGFGELGAKYEPSQLWSLAAWVVQLLIGLALIFRRHQIIRAVAGSNDR